MNWVGGRLHFGHLLGLLLVLLLGSAVVADFSVQQRFNTSISGDAIRWVVLLVGVCTLGLLAREIARKDRPNRSHHYFTAMWLVGVVMVIGLVQTLPTPPAL